MLEHSDASTLPGYACAKKGQIFWIFYDLTVQNYKTVYLMSLSCEYT